MAEKGLTFFALGMFGGFLCFAKHNIFTKYDDDPYGLFAERKLIVNENLYGTKEKAQEFLDFVQKNT